jgi:flagellar protein FliS
MKTAICASGIDSEAMPATLGKANAAAPMASAGAADDSRQYVAARVMSASPIELVLIMYEQLFALAKDIKANIARRAPAAVEPDAERAQAIIDELVNSLDFSVEISKDLGAIYFYVRDRILEANIKFDSSIWDHIEQTMRPLYEGFADAARQAAEAAPGAGGTGAAPSSRPAIVAGMTYGHGTLKEVVVNTKKGLRV